MENFKIYRDTQYDTRANIKLKLDEKLEDLKETAALRLEEFDYYWKNHKRMVR